MTPNEPLYQSYPYLNKQTSYQIQEKQTVEKYARFELSLKFSRAIKPEKFPLYWMTVSKKREIYKQRKVKFSSYISGYLVDIYFI